MAKNFEEYEAALESPADIATAVVASAAVLSPKPKAVFVEVAGSITWTDAADTSHTWALGVGYHPIRPTKVTAITDAVVWALHSSR